MYDVPAWKNICPPSVPLLGPKNKLPSEDTDVAPIDTVPLTWRVAAGDVVPIPTLPPSAIETLILPDVLRSIPLKPCISTFDDPLLI